MVQFLYPIIALGDFKATAVDLRDRKTAPDVAPAWPLLPWIQPSQSSIPPEKKIVAGNVIRLK
jgi:hypothetical protein